MFNNKIYKQTFRVPKGLALSLMVSNIVMHDLK